MTFVKMVDYIPEGRQGIAKVEHFEVSEHDSVFAGIRREFISPGRYCRLYVDGSLMMSDGDMEHQSNSRAVYQAEGDVLIAGLGIGMILIPILRNPKVRSVLVLEKYRDVIDLVEPPVRAAVRADADKLTVLKADVFEWTPAKDQKFDTIYFDIWPVICTDQLPEITKLKRKFCRRLRPGGWMKAWQEDHLRSLRRREKIEEKDREMWRKIWKQRQPCTVTRESP